MISIRPIRADDASAYTNLCAQLDSESNFMLPEPGERAVAVEEQRARIEQMLKTANQMIFLAMAVEKGNIQAVGYLMAMGGAYRRNAHTAHIVVGVLQAYANQGIGTRLFETMEAWARSRHMRRLELTVMTHNRRALALYRKMGFEIEGTRQCSLRVNDQWVDEFTMSKLLSVD